MKRKLPTWLLIGAIALSLLVPVRPALAATSMSLTDIYPWDDLNISHTVQDGGTIDPSTTVLKLFFNRGTIDPATVAGNVQVTDEAGQDLGWQAAAVPGYYIVEVQPPVTPLPLGQSLVLHIRGGADGLKNLAGDTLAQDVVYHLTVSADAPFILQPSFRVDSPTTALMLENGALIPRNASEVTLYLNRTLGSNDEASQIAVTDSQGRDAHWQIHTGGQAITLRPAAELAKNETYTVTVKGGPDGLKSMNGITLPADLAVTVHTDDQAYLMNRYVKTAQSLYQIRQTESYQLTASPGPLTVTLFSLTHEDQPVHVTIRNAETGAKLLDQSFGQGEPLAATVSVPQAATYRLTLAPNQVDQVEVSGMDVVLAHEAPAVKLPALTEFQWLTQPLTVNVAAANPSITGAMDVFLLKGDVDAALDQLNGGAVPTVHWAPSVDNTVPPLTIDPAKLTDGVYTLLGAGFADDAQGWSYRLVVVDKAPVFADVPASHWARRWVDVLSYLGVVNGRGASLFAPGAQVKRSEFAKMLALALGLKPASVGNDFADVADDWSRPYIEALYQAKLITGDVVNGQRYFYPNKTISRADAAVMLGRALGVTDGAYTGTTDLTDFSQVPTYAQQAVAALTQEQMLTGFPDGTFRPQVTLQRDQAAKILGSAMGITQGR